MTLHIPVVLGTARKGRQSEHVAKFVVSELEKQTDVTTELVDPRDYVGAATVPAWEESKKLEPWRDIILKSDGFIFVVPEYNHSFPGELKMLLDGAFKEYAGRAAGICGVSSGIFGGARAIEHLKHVLVKFKLYVSPTHVFFGTVEELFDESGAITDAAFAPRLEKTFAEVIAYAEATKSLRT